jgi:hypothetical protein
MRLTITHHAFIRFTDWKPEHKDCVPPGGPVLIDRQAALGMMKLLGLMVLEMERAFPAVMPERRADRTRQKYNRESCYFYDRASQDLYQMAPRDGYATVLTVTKIERIHRQRKILNDISPPIRFSQVTRLGVPYFLGKEAREAVPAAVRTPSGRELPIFYGCNDGKAARAMMGYGTTAS